MPPPKKFGRRGRFYFGLSTFEGFEFAYAFAGQRYAVCSVDNTVKYRIRHLRISDCIVPVQFGQADCGRASLCIRTGRRCGDALPHG